MPMVDIMRTSLVRQLAAFVHAVFEERTRLLRLLAERPSEFVVTVWSRYNTAGV